MIGIVLASHGPLAEGMKAAAEMIVGQQQHFLTVGMGAAADVDDLRAQIEDAATRVTEAPEVEGAVVLVDLMGGSPSNACAYLASGGAQVVCGVNLPMLLEVLMNRDDMSAQALAEFALQAGKDGIISLTQVLLDAQNHP